MAVFLGIDIGTSSTKTLAVDETGRVLGEASAEYPLAHPKPLWSEQDPEDWWTATKSTIKSVVEKSGLKKADVRAIGLSGQMHGSVFLDKDDRVIRPALLWNDQRTAAECEEITARAGGKEELLRMVANPALTGFTAPKILWLRNHEPAHFARLKRVLLPKDDVRRRLTGEYATEVSDASGMLLLDVANRRWSDELLGRLDLDRSLLGTVHESHEVTGTLRKDVADELGLSPETVVVGGAGDCAAGAIGNGIVRRGVCSTSLGTSGVVFVHSDAMQTDPAGRLHTFCHAVDGAWHMMGVTLSAAGSLEWFVKAIGRDAEVAAGENYKQLMAEAEKTPTGADGLFFLPYLSGERTPHADPLARGAWIGLTASQGRGHLVRAIVEGVTYSLRESLELFRKLSVPVDQIRATGGGARSPFWRQVQADVFGQPVSTINVDQGPAFGVALLAAVGAGAFKDIVEACDATIKLTDTVGPRRDRQAFYDAAFPVYQGFYGTLKSSFPVIADLPTPGGATVGEKVGATN